MTRSHSEADARIAIDDRLRQAGWDPRDKSMVGIEIRNGYHFAASRCKPHVAEELPEEDPAELIREVFAIARETTSGLEKLLEEVER